MKVKHDAALPGVRSRDIVLAALFFALLTALVETVVKGFRSRLLHEIVWISRDFVWMTPLAYLVFFMVPAIALLVFGPVTRRAVPLSWIITVFAALTLFAWLLPFNQIWRVASALLAVGAGWRLAGVVTRSPERWWRACRLGTLAMAAFFIVAAAAERSWRALAERRALAALPAADAGRPNVLVIVWDTVRRSNLGLYGYPHPTTPSLQRWAASATVFDRAIVTAPWTLPSHGSLFTGLSAGDVGGNWTEPISRRPRTLAQVLSAHGYLSGGFVANLLYTSYESGLARGFAHYDDYQPSLHLVLVHASFGRTRLMTKVFEAKSLRAVARGMMSFDLGPSRVPADVFRPADDVTDAFLAWQRDAGGRPFFAFLNYFDAHWPAAPEPFLSQLGATTSRMPTYDGAIAFLDHQVDRILDSLQSRGVLERTLVVVTSDHGEQFGEHNLTGHANSLYLTLLSVPLLVRYPAAVPSRQRVDALVTLRDLPATVLDLAGIRDDTLPGLSLSRYWRTTLDAAPSDVIAEVTRGQRVDSTFPNARGPMVSRLDDRLHYIRDGLGRDELYAYRTDSLELDNLAARPEWQADLQRLRDGLVRPARTDHGPVALRAP